MTVYLVEHHELLRETLASRLSTTPGIRVVGGCGSAELAVTDIARLGPQVAIIGDGLPDGDDLSMCWHLARAVPRLRVILYSTLPGPSDAFLADLLGVSAWVLKEIRIGPLVQALRAAFCEVLRADGGPPGRSGDLR